MKKTKLALLQSVISLLLCVSMLLGTTFAWFTDTVTSENNIIVSGKLDAEMYWTDDISPDTGAVVWQDASEGAIFNYGLWEPGYTQTRYVKISNKGNLAFRYRLNILPDMLPSGDVNLADVIDVYLFEGSAEITRADVKNATPVGTLSALMQKDSGILPEVGSLLPGAERDLCIVLKMQESAGNEYQNKSVGSFKVMLLATQETHENDSFGPDYDTDAQWPAVAFPSTNLNESVSGTVNVADNKVAEDATLQGNAASAQIPAGVQVSQDKLTLSVSEKESSDSNIVLGENEALRALDVHMDGVAADNTQPMEITIKKMAPVGLNMGNYKLYHVEPTGTVEMAYIAADAPFTAHNQFKYDPATGDVTLYMATFSEVAVVAEAPKWKGNFDYSWYTNAVAPVEGEATAANYVIANADQLAAFGAIVGGMAEGIEQDSFAGKTVKLIADINLGDDEKNNVEGKIFYPIGYNSSDGKYEKTGTAVTTGFYNFCGTFDGNGHTISNFYQNTWEMKGDNNYYDATLQYYRDGMGLFGKVYGGTVKNLTVDNFSSDGEYTTTGVIAAYADGATFENISIFNCNPRVYNIGNGGIVGCVGWYAKEANLKTTFKNITVDNSNKISALWGSYDVACGGIVGQYYPTSGQSSANYPVNAGIHFENCHVAAQMDVYNDVCANYQYYAYRYTGMLIGSVRENVTINGHVYPKMDGITAENCTVHFGTWNDYYYCEIIDNTTASYTHDYQMSRLTEIRAIDGTTITYLDGTTGTVPASGRANYVIVNYTKGHGTANATCYHFKDGAVWTHDMGGIQTGIDENGDGQDDLKEDKQHIYLEFNNLVTGYGWGVTSRGLANLDGVTNLDITEGEHEESVEKFKVKLSDTSDALVADKDYMIGDLFAAIENVSPAINGSAVQVAVSAVGNSGITAEYVANTSDWTQGTLTFNKIEGLCTVTIQDYNFCKPTTFVLRDGKVTDLQKFAIVFPNVDKYLYRVGNQNNVSLSSLFKEADIVPEDDKVNVEVTGVAGDVTATYTSNTTKWEDGTLKFSGTGVVTVTISEDGAFEKELYLEVVAAKNYPSPTTGASLSATANNVVLLENVSFSTITVSGGHFLYGNGFTMTASEDSPAKQMSYAFVELNNGVLDNIQVVCPNFSHAILYDYNKSEDGNKTDGDGRYYNIRSAVIMTGNSTIVNSYISGGRAAVYISSGIATIDNSTIAGGAVANIDIAVVNSVLLKDLTLIQKPFKATVNDASKTLMGFSGLVTCASDGSTADIRLEGNLSQYAWVDENDAQYTPSSASGIITNALEQTEFLHDVDQDGVKESLNLGFTFIPAEKGGSITPSIKENDNRSNKTSVPYDYASVGNSLASAIVYSYVNTSGTTDEYLSEPAYSPSMQDPIPPTVSYHGAMDGCQFVTVYDDTNGWNSTLTVDLDTVGSYNFSFDSLVATKYGQSLEYTVTDANGATVETASLVELAGSCENKYTLSIIDDLLFDAAGKKIEGKTVVHEYSFTLIATMSKINPPELTISTATALPIATNYKNDDWTCAVPALENITVTYWSTTEKKYKENVALSELINWSGINVGKQTATGTNNNVWTYEGADFTLEITGGTVKSDPVVYTIPVVVNKDNAKQLYFVASNSTDGMVSNGTTSRSTSLTYKFTDKNQAYDSDSRSWTVTYSSDVKDKPQYNYSKFCSGILQEVTGSAPTTCIAEGTQITMADGTKRAVEDLRKGDMVMSYDHVNGVMTSNKVIIVVKTESDSYYKNTFVFDDGSELVTINEHGIYDWDLRKYVNIDHLNAEEFIGHRFVAVDTNGIISLKKLVAVDTVVESGYKYDIVTDQTLNYVAEDTLSVTHVLVDVINSFDFNGDMRYDQEKMQSDIEKYGLYTYDEWEEYCDISVFEQYNIPVMKVGISKGLYTKEYIIGLINTYVLDDSVQIIN